MKQCIRVLVFENLDEIEARKGGSGCLEFLESVVPA